MLYSMTGYGRAQGQFQGQTIHIEIKSLNSKSLDLRLRLPQVYQSKELELRRLLSEAVIHGKLDFSLHIENALEADYRIDPGLFEHYHRQLKQLAERQGLEPGDLLYTLSRLPGVVVPQEAAIEEGHWQIVLDTVALALERFKDYRRTEGAQLQADVCQRVALIQDLLKEVEPLEAERLTRVRQRIAQNFEKAELKLKVDENRFEQEMIFYLEKFDISEEKTRLSQHCQYFLEVIEAEALTKGSKLNFIMQEMGREINTIGSKANSADIQRLVVQMKDEAEKIKEQLANIL